MTRNKKNPVQYFNYLFSMPTQLKYAIVVVVDVILMVLALWIAIALRWGDINITFDRSAWMVAIFTSGASAFIYSQMGFYRAVVRHMGQQAMVVVIYGLAISALVCALSMVIFKAPFPRSTPFLYWIIALFLLGGVRLLIRTIFFVKQRNSGVPVAIYGAGASGRQLLNALSDGSEYAPIAFIDDNSTVIGRTIDGIPVIDSQKINQLIEDYAIVHVLLALPSITCRRRQQVIESLESLNISVKTVPNMTDLVSGRLTVQDLKSVTIEDLLERDSIPPDAELLNACVKDKVVLVTGSGGSIGSELARQILQLKPKKLLLLDHSEYALYLIERELNELLEKKKLTIEVIAYLANTQDQKRIESICRNHQVKTIYHAAAYKHVPIVEKNIIEGLRNNVFGALSVGKAAVATNVENVVLISTDKAVRHN